MDFDKKTFCVAPWFQIRNTQQGEYRVCCASDFGKSQFVGQKTFRFPESSPEEFLRSEYITYLRQQLTQGTKLPECHRCWTKEQLGGRSLRQSLLETVTKNQSQDLEQTWISSYFQHKKDYQQDLLISADVKLTYVCNFSCAMCEPADSSQIFNQWNRDRSHPWIQIQIEKNPGYLDSIKNTYKDRSNHVLLEQILEKKPRMIKLLGGEPLLDRAMFDVLESLNTEQKNKTSLLFVTNGSVDLISVSQRLQEFQSVDYTVSLEAIGAVQDYIRRGSQWSQIESNILRWLEEDTTRFLSIQATAQALSLYHLPDLIDWCKNKRVRLNIDLADRPNYMMLCAVPPDMKQRFLDQIDIRQDPHLSYLVTVLSKVTHDPIATQDLKKFLEWYDPDSAWREILPEWRHYL